MAIIPHQLATFAESKAGGLLLAKARGICTMLQDLMRELHLHHAAGFDASQGLHMEGGGRAGLRKR